MARFTDRRSAGDELASALRPLCLADPVVLAIPKGGVLVAAAVSQALGALLDLVDVHEVTAHRSDMGLGAVRSSGEHSVRESTAKAVGVDHDELDEKLAGERTTDLSRLLIRVRATHESQSLADRTAVVIDDGLLVAGAAVMAVEQARARGATAVVLGVPIGIDGFVAAAAELYDQVICLERSTGHTDLGVPLLLGLRFVGVHDEPLAGIDIEIWHADAQGRYSGFAPLDPDADPAADTEASAPTGAAAPAETFLRGRQTTDGTGTCAFRTIWPGWYRSRTVHIHLIAHVDDRRRATTQLYFPDDLTDQVLAAPPYNDRGGRDTTNATDAVFAEGGEASVLQLHSDDGWTGSLCLGIGNET